MPSNIFTNYTANLTRELKRIPCEVLELWAEKLQTAWREDRQFFICGNGGSAANAIHLANDFLYGISPEATPAMRVLALPSNPSVLTCLGNDIGYEAIFSQQLETLGRRGDLLMVFSGSGNSPNVIEALKTARKLKLVTFAILGFSGGICKALADNVLHFEIEDMQIAEDLQLIIGHMLMQRLYKNGQEA